MTDVTPQRFIGSQFRVKLEDSRALTGILTVVDPFGNLLLSEVVEDSDDLIDNTPHRRELGIVSVPRSTIVSIEMEAKSFRALGLRAEQAT